MSSQFPVPSSQFPDSTAGAGLETGNWKLETLRIERYTVVPLFSSGRYQISRVVSAEPGDPEVDRPWSEAELSSGLVLLTRTDGRERVVRIVTFDPKPSNPDFPHISLRIHPVVPGHPDLDPEEGLAFLCWFSFESFETPTFRPVDAEAMGILGWDQDLELRRARHRNDLEDRLRPIAHVGRDHRLRLVVGMQIPWTLPLPDFLSWLEESSEVATGSDNG